ncbi:MAG TPA: DEAD/DEAH box helicase [Opitutaceae bacterium]|nr:DEAD/DEAH box helicase [Opitutaceae bacterium]
MSSSPSRAASNPEPPAFPPAHDWRTTDEHERARRRARAVEEQPRVRVLDPGPTVFGRHSVTSRSKRTYTVELRALGSPPGAACECVDFRINGLGTCKHVEAVLLHAERVRRTAWRNSLRGADAQYVTLLPSADGAALHAEGPTHLLPPSLRNAFDSGGRLKSTMTPEQIAGRLERQPLARVRLGLESGPWLEARRRAAERTTLRREYETRVQSGAWPAHETLVPLFPYQREGMLHLAFTERALLADEMGLGKTIQAIAACALLQRLGCARRVLVVTPASLKTEWEEQIRRFTALSLRIVYGGRLARLACYNAEDAPFFTLVNYEQVVPDTLEINSRLQPDIVVLDEAQRIKNWTTKTAQAIKRLRSRYAFVLTGTPLENRIDELYSLVDFLDPQVFGPLFRFNREFYTFDERGRPAGYQNLERLNARLQPLMLRRRKADVEKELPERTDHVRLVTMSDVQRQGYAGHEQQVSRLVHLAKRRPLLPAEQDKLMREMAMMRMICDTNFILGDEDRTCPKLAELESILAECRDNAGVKIIVFSEWERMLVLVRELCGKLRLGCAWHTGTVPQQKRRGEINRFKTDPACRVFLSTDSGGVGLNLQNASVVVNCDLPWNPAKLEQRIARAWRKHQTRAVTIYNLVTAESIEHGMLATLADKRSLAEGVLDRVGDLSQIKLRSGRQAQIARLEQVMLAGVTPAPAAKPAPPADPAAEFARVAALAAGERLIVCEERHPLAADGAPVLVAVVERDADLWRPRLEAAHANTWKLSPADAPRLLVIDRATQAALDALATAGLVAVTTAATRALHPAGTGGNGAAPVTLSTEEKQRIAELRTTAARRLKAARALFAAELIDEAAASAREALHATVSALALSRRWKAPPDSATCARAPWSVLVPALHNFASGGSIDAQALDSIARTVAGD